MPLTAANCRTAPSFLFLKSQRFLFYLRAFASRPCPSSPSSSWPSINVIRSSIVRHETTTTSASDDNNRGGIITGTVPRDGIGIQAGQIAESRRIFTQSDVDTFAHLSGDSNPLHQSPQLPATGGENDEDVPPNGQHPTAIVHGILVASLFSHIFGSLIPGCVYRKQSLHFREPIHVDDSVVGRIEVVEVRKLRGGRQVVHCETTVVKETATTTDEIMCVQGRAEVLLPPPSST
uniref:MaoC-like domain-containing protein n=1 Tax=Amphora coffeiformis TaxID=265554 RepID=A0A7S3L539_9STRA|eukprot:scaffold9620_cov197-Amphora_coffeaeformis.AAC.4